MKHSKYILLVIVLLLSNGLMFSESEKDHIDIIFSFDDSNLNPNVDTLHFYKDIKNQVYIYQNSVYLNNKKIYIFKDLKYYIQILYMHSDNHYYLYVYPHLKDRVGPYIWYELGIVLDISKKDIIIRSNCNYYDLGEIDRLFDFSKTKEVRHINLNK